jgi:hypothetical protein
VKKTELKFTPKVNDRLQPKVYTKNLLPLLPREPSFGSRRDRGYQKLMKFTRRIAMEVVRNCFVLSTLKRLCGIGGLTVPANALVSKMSNPQCLTVGALLPEFSHGLPTGLCNTVALKSPLFATLIERQKSR